MTQRLIVLEALRAAGDRGIHTFELRRDYIGNPSERIRELKADGHMIRAERERLRGQAWGVRYWLEHDAERVSPPEPSPVSELNSALFDATGFEHQSAFRQPLGAYEVF